MDEMQFARIRSAIDRVFRGEVEVELDEPVGRIVDVQHLVDGIRKVDLDRPRCVANVPVESGVLECEDAERLRHGVRQIHRRLARTRCAQTALVALVVVVPGGRALSSAAGRRRSRCQKEKEAPINLFMRTVY